jgi:plastocyanin domain-containing protein
MRLMIRTMIAVVISVALMAGVIFLLRGKPEPSATSPVASKTATTSNVSIGDDQHQIVAIGVKGGYTPSQTEAKANTPTTLKFVTSGTFDCSASLSIPALNYRNNLPPTGETLVEVPPQPAGTTLSGTCGMGMYGFSVRFD